MGRFSVEIELANYDDMLRAKAGLITAEQVRRTRLKGAVDTGAGRLVIPESIAQQLGVEQTAKVKVRYADGRIEERSIAQNVHLSYDSRDSVFRAVVEPGMEEALIGAIVLEELDFLVDCFHQRLVPRDPKQIITEV